MIPCLLRTAFHIEAGGLTGTPRTPGQFTTTRDPDEAHLILAALVAALALSRAVDDPHLSDEILTRTARALARDTGTNPPG